jgi:hypothetical protein
MNGISARVYRDSEFETVYFWAGRSGQVGKRVRDLMRLCSDAERDLLRAQKQTVLVARSVPDEADYETLAAASEKQDVAIQSAAEARRRLDDLACDLALESLSVNYGREEAERIVDCYTDVQLRSLHRLLETGLEPPDFFPAPVTPPNANATPPPADSSAGSPSKPAIVYPEKPEN